VTMARLALTVCELPDHPDALAEAWAGLVDHVTAARSDVVLLPELPFAPWLAGRRTFDLAAWDQARRGHDRWIGRLPELGAAATVATRPVDDGGRRLNQAFVWTADSGAVPLHVKTVLPEEAGFWERTWTSPGSCPPAAATIAAARFGTLICSELWFSGLVADLGRASAQILLAPRATTGSWSDRWLVAGRAAALCGGLYVASSNRVSPQPGGFGGQGWVIDPGGDLLATTSPAQPAVTVEVDTAVADQAKSSYPHYLFRAAEPPATPGGPHAQ
jgi:N-carbamoylputrescine amidase